jgi:hypothetical protein
LTRSGASRDARSNPIRSAIVTEAGSARIAVDANVFVSFFIDRNATG